MHYTYWSRGGGPSWTVHQPTAVTNAFKQVYDAGLPEEEQDESTVRQLETSPAFWRESQWVARSASNGVFSKLLRVKDFAVRAPNRRPRLSLVVYKMAPMIYHSAVKVGKTLELHFFEGAGITELKRADPFTPPTKLNLCDELDLGSSQLSAREFLRMMMDLELGEFAADQYDVLSWNCNHFTETVSHKCGVGSNYPGYVNRAARLAGAIMRVIPNWSGKAA